MKETIMIIDEETQQSPLLHALYDKYNCGDNIEAMIETLQLEIRFFVGQGIDLFDLLCIECYTPFVYDRDAYEHLITEFCLCKNGPDRLDYLKGLEKLYCDMVENHDLLKQLKKEPRKPTETTKAYIVPKFPSIC